MHVVGIGTIVREWIVAEKHNIDPVFFKDTINGVKIKVKGSESSLRLNRHIICYRFLFNPLPFTVHILNL